MGEKKSDSSDGAVDHIEVEHEETMQRIGDWLPRMEKQKTTG